MIEVKKYQLQPTKLVPNSKYPLLHYSGLLSASELSPAKVHDRYANHGWETQWIFRYGPTQRSHYHSRTHECMVVLSGTATLRFGVADTSDDEHANTYGSDYEQGGVEVEAKAGDAFIIPCGVSHKTYNVIKGSTFKLLTPGGGHAIEGDDPRKVLEEIEVSGFTMQGAYPIGGEWDFAVGGEDEGRYDKVWRVPKPPKDPFLGDSKDGLCGQWTELAVKRSRSDSKL